MPFPFEKLTVYTLSLDLVDRIRRLVVSSNNQVPFSFLDQLTRAALSIPLNISEGQGRWHIKEKKQFYWIARGSAFEVVSLLQIFRRAGALDELGYQTLYASLETVAKMLTNLIKSVDNIRREIHDPKPE